MDFQISDEDDQTTKTISLLSFTIGSSIGFVAVVLFRFIMVDIN